MAKVIRKYLRGSSYWFTVIIIGLTMNISPVFAETAAQPSDRKLRIVLVGDSTVTDTSGWGLGFKQFVKDHAECINVAANGRSSRSYIGEGRWTKALDLKGDYYLIQFGHNDQPGKGDRSTDPNTTYRQFITRYVDDVRAIDAEAVLVTSLTRRKFDESGKIKSSLIPYVEVVKSIAAEKKVPLIDLHAGSIELCEKMGPEKCCEFSPEKDDGRFDTTHLNAEGSVVFGRLVVEGLVEAVPELKPYFRSEPDADVIKKSARIFNVCEFGAMGDGKTLDTAAIQLALDRCGRAGGGIVRIPAGTYLSKPVFLRSNTTLQLDEGAVLQATDEPNDFTDSERGLVGFVNGNTLTNVAVTGKGRIDGAGVRWWGPAEEAKRARQPEPRRRPRMVVFNSCVGLRVQGVTLTNSPSFHLIYRDCEDVDIEGLTILAPEDSPNTDAIDLSASRHVRISNCYIDVGDDNIAIKSGHMDSAHPNAACEDITITDCTFAHGHGVSIGSETFGGVRSLTVKRCTFENTESGIRIKSYRGRGGLVQDITYSDITMKNVNVPVSISCYYPKIPGEDSSQLVTLETPIYRNIRIENVTATSPRSAGVIVGLPEAEVSDVVLKNICISAPRGLVIRNAKKIKLKDVKIETQQGEPFILDNAEVEGMETADSNAPQ